MYSLLDHDRPWNGLGASSLTPRHTSAYENHSQGVRAGGRRILQNVSFLTASVVQRFRLICYDSRHRNDPSSLA
jgi:hypothetical protein